jgi:hypothetical protein
MSSVLAVQHLACRRIKLTADVTEFSEIYVKSHKKSFFRQFIVSLPVGVVVFVLLSG